MKATKHAGLTVKRVRFNQTKPHPDNPRVHPPAGSAEYERLKASLASSYFDPMVVNTRTGRMVSGHFRRLILMAEGFASADMVVVDWDEPTHKARMIAANELLGHYDDAKLLALIQGGIDPELSGLTDERIKELIAASAQTDTGVEAEPQITNAEKLAKKWKVKLGQVWACGDHRIICGDSTHEPTIKQLMGEDRATLMFTDPPYGVAIGAKNRMLNSFQKAGRNLTDIASDQISAKDLKAMLLKCFTLSRSIMADDCAVFVCSPQGGELGMMMMMMMMEAGLEIRHVLNWVKNSPTFSMGRLDYDYQHEPILYTWNKSHKRHRNGQFQTSVWSVDKPRKSGDHPTMKPVELPVNAILNHTDALDICYEPFSGSGTMIIACEQTGRRCRAVEIDPGYVAVALERFHEATGNTPTLVQ